MAITDMIQKLKDKNNLLLNQEYKKLEKGDSFKGGSIEISVVVVIIKIVLLTIGTFVLSWWPYVFIIALYSQIIINF